VLYVAVIKEMNVQVNRWSASFDADTQEMLVERRHKRTAQSPRQRHALW